VHDLDILNGLWKCRFDDIFVEAPEGAFDAMFLLFIVNARIAALGLCAAIPVVNGHLIQILVEIFAGRDAEIGLIVKLLLIFLLSYGLTSAECTFV
jgi:hypothetical protein